MASASSINQRGSTLVSTLGVLILIALMVIVVQNLFFSPERVDPRADDRFDNLAEVKAAQATNVAKMGLEPGKSAERLAKALEVLKNQKPSTSAMLVPGSPTQLKQAAAPAPAAKPTEAPPAAAPAPAPAK